MDCENRKYIQRGSKKVQGGNYVLNRIDKISNEEGMKDTPKICLVKKDIFIH